MYLSSLSLHEFRNYKQLNLALGKGLFLFYGENAQGKTNLLEAVSMLATGSSLHAAADREVVNWDAPDHVARLDGLVKRELLAGRGSEEDEVQLEMVIFDPTPNNMVFGQGENSAGAVPIQTVELPATTPRKRVKV